MKVHTHDTNASRYVTIDTGSAHHEVLISRDEDPAQALRASAQACRNRAAKDLARADLYEAAANQLEH